MMLVDYLSCCTVLLHNYLVRHDTFCEHHQVHHSVSARDHELSVQAHYRRTWTLSCCQWRLLQQLYNC